MAIRLPDGSIQMADGRVVYANSLIQAQDLIEILPLLIPPPAWPFVSGGGGGGSGSGTPGARGADGAAGPQGPQGTNPGVQGPQGIGGPQGNQGLTGSGAQGNQGNQGNTGAGAQGFQGFQGPTGTLTNDIFASDRVVDPAGAGTDTTLVAAIAALPATGGEIFLKVGAYVFASTVVLPNKNVTIRSSGDGTTFTAPSGLPLFSIAAAFTGRYAFEGFQVAGDNSAGQSLIDISSSVDIKFTDVHTTALHDIIVTTVAPEVSCTYCSFTMTSGTTTASFWRGTAGGVLNWEYVEASFSTQSSNGIVGAPDWVVTASYIGSGGPAKTICDVGKVTIQGFRIDKIRLDIGLPGSTIVNMEGIDSRVAIHNVRASITGSTFTTPTLVDNQIIIVDGPASAGGVVDVAIAGCTFNGSNVVFSAVQAEAEGVVITGCSFSNLGVGNATDGAIQVGAFNDTKVTVIGCKFSGALAGTQVTNSVFEFNVASTITGYYDGNLGFNNALVISTFSTINGIRRYGNGVPGFPPGDGTGTTTAALVELFTHKNSNGVIGIGTIKNTGGVNSMDVKETVTDGFGVTDSTTTAVAPGNSLMLDVQTNFGTARPPNLSYKVEVIDTVAASHTTYSVQFSSTGPY